MTSRPVKSMDLYELFGEEGSELPTDSPLPHKESIRTSGKVARDGHWTVDGTTYPTYKIRGRDESWILTSDLRDRYPERSSYIYGVVAKSKIDRVELFKEALKDISLHGKSSDKIHRATLIPRKEGEQIADTLSKRSPVQRKGGMKRKRSEKRTSVEPLPKKPRLNVQNALDRIGRDLALLCALLSNENPSPHRNGVENETQ